MLCVDEKSQVQALDRSQPLLPMRPGQAERRTHDYKRNGTTSLFAALDVKAGTIVGKCMTRHRATEFRKFLDEVERNVPADLDIHVVMDNYGTHKTKLIRNWFAKRPRWHVHFTPTSASWINQVERFFALLTDRASSEGYSARSPNSRRLSTPTSRPPMPNRNPSAGPRPQTTSWPASNASASELSRQTHNDLAGYQAVIDGAAEYDRALPMMMTAAGTVPAARIFVMGVGVAGLQAIATARRLGGVVTATDVRPAVKEQVQSLGAKFLAVEDEEFKAAETAGGYAKEMSKEYQAKQAALTAEHIAKQDIVITTALIPGRPAPKLVSAAVVASMKAGSVIVDLAVERGGNVEGAEAGKVVTTANGVKIVGHLNVAGRVAASASLLYARNLFAFLETMVDKGSKQIAINRDDELVKATMLTDGGKVVHPNFAGAAPAAEAVEPASVSEPDTVAPADKPAGRRKASTKKSGEET